MTARESPSSCPACECSPRRPPLSLSLSPFPHRFDNTLPPHELHLAVAQGAVVARADGPTRPRCAVRARGDGSIDVTVMANLSGDYRLHIWVNGAQVPACPYPLRVFANRALLRDAAEAARELMAADGDGGGPIHQPRSPRRSGDGAVVGAIGASRPNVPHAHDSAIRIQKGSFGRGTQSKLGNLESPRRDSPRTRSPAEVTRPDRRPRRRPDRPNPSRISTRPSRLISRSSHHAPRVTLSSSPQARRRTRGQCPRRRPPPPTTLRTVPTTARRSRRRVQFRRRRRLRPPRTSRAWRAPPPRRAPATPRALCRQSAVTSATGPRASALITARW